jgi:hypothetical protein
MPDEARQFGVESSPSPVAMDAERWLQADLKFNNETLQQNRALLISESQIRPFQKKHNKNVRYAMIATGVVAVAIVQGLFLIGLFIDWRACLFCLPMTVIAIASGAVRWATGQGKTSAENLTNLTVTETIAVVGDPDPNWGPYWQSAMLALKAEGKPLQMKVPKRYFQIGNRYRLYYVHENKKILSAEKIENGAS